MELLVCEQFSRDDEPPKHTLGATLCDEIFGRAPVNVT
jgi:hypothetical protein